VKVEVELTRARALEAKLRRRLRRADGTLYWEPGKKGKGRGRALLSTGDR
jgi:hypothetical protein